MIVPSIDLMGGQTVQLVGGEDKALDAGDPVPIAKRFALSGDLAVVDLDAALGQGSNAELIEKLLPIVPCRVGGGIRDVDTALAWLDAGASKIVLGTAAKPELLKQLPRDRVIAALDAKDGEVVVEGWRKGTGQGIEARMQELAPYVSGFLVTLVEREGRLEGSDLGRVQQLAQAAGECKLTIAGGVTSAEEVGEIDKLGVDAQVGMALYTGRMDFGEAIAAPLRSDRPDGLWPTVVVNERGQALGLVYSNLESVKAAVAEQRGIYYSRSRSGLWRKGESSGAVQELLRVELDCDRDALRFVVRQSPPGFCHLDADSCWGPLAGLSALEHTLRGRKQSAPEGSYTSRLYNEPGLLEAKIREEAAELAEAATPAHATEEMADLLYFAMAKMSKLGISLEAVEAALDRRTLRVSRRPGNAKPAFIKPESKS